MFTRLLITVIYQFLFLSGKTQLQRFSFTQPKMGSPFTIIMYSADTIIAPQLAQQCFNLVDSFVFIFSDYIDSSEISKLSATASQNNSSVILSPALFDILKKGAFAFNTSEGAFDVTIGPLSKLWRKCRKSNQFPEAEMVQESRKQVGFKKLIFDTINKKLSFERSGMQLDLGGIAQGYIAQQVLDFLKSRNICHALVNASGDIVMSNPPPGMDGWTVGINFPEQADAILPRSLLLQNKAITTSGDLYQFIEHEGKRYSHIIDPKTGYGTTYQRNVTAIAGDGPTADWLATACSILSIKKSKKIAKRMGAEILISVIKKGKPFYYTTKGFADYWKGPTD